MGIDQKGTVVLKVTCTGVGQWQVLEQGFEKPLSSFADAEDAKEYAYGIARGRPGTQIEIYGDSGQLQSKEVVS